MKKTHMVFERSSDQFTHCVFRWHKNVKGERGYCNVAIKAKARIL